MDQPKHFKIYEDIETRELAERKARWVQIPEIIENTQYGKYRWRLLEDNKRDFEKIAALMKLSYPELHGSAHEFLHNPDSYKSLAEFISEKPSVYQRVSWLFVIGEYLHDTREFVEALALMMNKIDLSVFIAAFAIHPKHRGGRHIGMWERYFCTDYLENCGVEYAFTFATTNHIVSQRFFLKAGYALRGVIPGSFLVWAGVGERYRRENAVLMDKFFNEGEKLAPQNMRLVRKADRLWRVIEEINGKE